MAIPVVYLYRKYQIPSFKFQAPSTRKASNFKLQARDAWSPPSRRINGSMVVLVVLVLVVVLGPPENRESRTRTRTRTSTMGRGLERAPVDATWRATVISH
jgi:hypothetical protein